MSTNKAKQTVYRVYVKTFLVDEFKSLRAARAFARKLEKQGEEPEILAEVA